MEDVAVLIPFGHGMTWRTKALGHTKAWYETDLKGAEVHVGLCTDVWSKATAIAQALAETQRSILVIADADCITPGIEQAVNAVRQGADWAMPHLKVYRMSQEATLDIYKGTSPGSLTGRNVWLDQSPYKGFEGGGITVLHRDIYLNCPLDPAFTGWGQEDEAWAMALNGLYGPPWRGVAPLYHLWHEKPVRLNRYAGSAATLARLAEYKEARIHSSWSELLRDARAYATDVISRCRVAI